MPTYVYELVEGQKGCDACGEGFELVQSMADSALAKCPECKSKIRRVIFAASLATPKSDRELKELGFKKYVRKDKGVYEEVTNDGKEPRIVDANKSLGNE